MRKGLALVLVLAMCFSLCSCDNSSVEQTTNVSTTTEKDAATTTTEKDVDISYSVQVHKGAENIPAADVEVYIYADSSLEKLIAFERTGSKGVVTFTLLQSSEYVVVLDNLPQQYEAEQSYVFEGNSANIVLPLKKGKFPEEVKLGDSMPEFTVIDCDGEEIVLSKLSDKEIVIVYFDLGLTDELLYMESVYQQYKENMSIVAFSYFGKAEIKDYKEKNNISFPIVDFSGMWLLGCPSFAIIDRYGDIVLVDAGRQEIYKESYLTLFNMLMADNYEQRFYNSVEEVAG